MRKPAAQKPPQTIYRIDGSGENYAIISKALLQDVRISHETKGLLCELLSRPKDWEVTAERIWKSGHSGRDKVLRMILEATQFGYIKTDRQRQEDGTWTARYFTVHDGVAVTPLPGNQGVDTTPWKPVTGIQGALQSKENKIKNLSLRAHARGSIEEDEGGISGAGWALTWPQIDHTAELCRVPVDVARLMARAMGQEWCTQGPPASPLATLRRALREEATHREKAPRRASASQAPKAAAAPAKQCGHGFLAHSCSQCRAKAAIERRQLQ